MTCAPDTTEIILACGGSDHAIHVFSLETSKPANEGLPKEAQCREVACLTGHESWVCSLGFTVAGKKDQECLLLASASQDKRVRLWKFKMKQGATQKTNCSSLQNYQVDLKKNSHLTSNQKESQLESDLHTDNKIPNRQKQDESPAFENSNNQSKCVSRSCWECELESIILAHDGWVSGVCWSSAREVLNLLTVGMDKTMALWKLDENTGLWVESVRVGEVGEVSALQLGFFAGTLSPDGKYMLGLGYSGTWHLWKEETAKKGEVWNSMVTTSGHSGEVREICWDPSSSYLVSASKDQTTRCWVKWVHSKPILREDGTLEMPVPTNNWSELGRIQAHGYGICGCAFIRNEKIRIASCSEEKILRIFEMPRAAYKTLNALGNIPLPSERVWQELSVTASLPALGLSNKPVNEKQIKQDVRKDEEELHSQKHGAGKQETSNVNSSREEWEEAFVSNHYPPHEVQLSKHTLWPEIAQLYGHGNNLVTVTSSKKGDLIASTCHCNVQTQEQAGIRLWETEHWRQVSVLEGPVLTVTQVEFSHDDQYLLAVSRDRGVYLYSRSEEKQYRLTWSDKKTAHQKIVWSGSWSIDDEYVATGSRDKCMKFWKLNRETNSLREIGVFKMAYPITSVAWMPYIDATLGYIIAVGYENGEITLWASSPLKDGSNAQIKQVIQISSQDSHVGHITRIAWGPATNRTFGMATASLDSSVRIFQIVLPENAP
ncbi:elongator complex protein 2-like [Schistocerca gregaria]|uniref:elongator complex protein 2-like n=1 Tax=Schistocerca gregaria TaxID=7010 RepID=UPI00211DCC58|nr:elongator complex protein 2-like [Schistocerca gregaria]